MAPQEELSEPLLGEEDNYGFRNNDDDSCPPQAQSVEVSEDVEEELSSPSSSSSSSSTFSVRDEIWEMISLGFPPAVSFFCRMGMASTDSSFVGHINDGIHTAEIYLAAAVLSDMCLSVFITPPLGFNSVLNALVGQAMGSGNPKMAGIWLQQSVFWLSITMLPCLIGLFYVEPVLLALDFSHDVSRAAGVYAKYNIVWPIPNGLYQCMRFYFQAQGLAQPAMYNNILFLFVNALLNWIFVFGGPFPWKGLGFIGAAVSLSISRTLQPVVYYLYMFVYKKHHLNTWPDEGWSLSHHTRDRTMEFLKQALPNLGTTLFQVVAGQTTTVLVGRLGDRAIAASSALSTVSIPWSGTLSATCSTISGVRVGYHLGRGDGTAANRTAWLVFYFITVIMVLVSIVMLTPLGDKVLIIATNDKNVLELSAVLVPAMLVGTYLNLMVGNITSGVFGGMGRPIIATILSFGFELPVSIGAVAIYILLFHGTLLGVYWLQAISGAVEFVVVLALMLASDWNHWAQEARRRQEAEQSSPNNTETDTTTASVEQTVEDCSTSGETTNNSDATASVALEEGQAA